MVVEKLRDWKLEGYWPYVPIQRGAVEISHLHQGVTDPFDARVPGSVYADLLRAGLIPDPYRDLNSRQCEWVENRWWVYSTAFTVDGSLRGRRLFLVFRGVDYKAHIDFNGAHLAEHEGMYEPVVLDITDRVRFGAENRLRVVLESAPDEMGQVGYTSRTRTQKARFTYKWDFCTRLVGMGIWDDVTLISTGEARILNTRVKYMPGRLQYTVETDSPDGRAEATLSYGGEPAVSAHGAVKNGRARLTFPIREPRLWYPNGYGDQPLYDLSLRLFDANGVLSDEKRQRVGLRTLTYTRPEGATAETLPYTPVVNGEKIYIKGVNMTPLDMMYGCVDRDRYRKILKLAKEANANLIRVWGGGIIEKEEFYDLCDEYGLMVWQEFIQSSSGLENTPSEIPSFLKLLRATATAAVTEKRDHVSLTFWSGGNELFESTGEPARLSNRNIAMLRRICRRLDPERLMLPTSASGPIGWRDDRRPATDHHDIHGPWKYAGARGPGSQYELYNTSPIELHSEFGVDGMTNLSAMKRFLSPSNRKLTSVTENLVWRHHGEWWDTGERDRTIFGEFASLEDFIKVSQFMQAEGIRYALEANRRRKWRNVGSIVWQFNEPWPNVSCTSLVDYYGRPKLAYYAYRDAMKPWHISMRYEQLLYGPGEVFRASLVPLDDPGVGWDALSVCVTDERGNVLLDRAVEASEAFSLTVPEDVRSFSVVCRMRKGRRSDSARYLFFVTDEAHPFADQKAVLRYWRAYRR